MLTSGCGVPSEKLALTQSQLDEISRSASEEETYKRQPLLSIFRAYLPTRHGFLSSESGSMGPDSLNFEAEANKIYRFIVGLDEGFPKKVSEQESDEYLHDPFTMLILKKGIFPLTANGILDAFDKTKKVEGGLKTRNVFLIGEGGKLPWNEATEKMKRTFRFTFSLEVIGGIGPDVLITTGTNLDSKDKFLQLMSWDPQNQCYNFFQRLGPFWIWSGNSFHAIDQKTRNKGPFSGHINGGPVMKELEQPWQNWHSMNAQIDLPQEHPLSQNSCFKEKGSADQFELLIKTGMDKVCHARIERSIQSGTIQDFKSFMRQILDSSNVNLVSSIEESRSVQPDTQVSLPFSFFANTQGLSHAGLEPAISVITVPSEIYLQSLIDFEFSLVSNGVKFAGDTHFAFFVPEVSREDMILLGKMIDSQMISQKMVACILMVDFANPVYSEKRKILLEYVPPIIKNGNGGSHFDEEFVQNVFQSGKSMNLNEPEGEFFSNWSNENWKKTFELKLEEYFEKLQQNCLTQEGFNNYVKLAEFRRQEFMKTSLHEFELTFAQTNIEPKEFPLQMTPMGTVVKK